MRKQIVKLACRTSERLQANDFQVERRIVGYLDCSLPILFQTNHRNFSAINKMRLVELWVTRNGTSYPCATIGEFLKEIEALK